MPRYSKRQLLKMMSASILASNLPLSVINRPLYAAEAYSGKYFIFCSFDGGWDQLMCTDPRDQTEDRFSAGKAIDPYYDEMSGVSDVVEDVTNGTGVYHPNAASNISVGPAMYEIAQAHWQDLCIVRGIDMGTLTHAVGRRYALTGKFPRGLQASGSALVTAATASMGLHTPIPNLVFGMETFNEGLPTWASGLTVRQPAEILNVLQPIGTPLDADTTSAIDRYLAAQSDQALKFNTDNIVDDYSQSLLRAKGISSGEYASYFNLNEALTAATAESSFGITKESQLGEANGQAFMAAQAIVNGLAQSVSVQLATGLDHHDEDLLSDHGSALREGFGALSNLITYLKSTPDHNGQPFWDRTVIMATSEFGRSPYINSQFGRDHHLTNSVLLAGAGIKGNSIVGGTNDTDYMRHLVDAKTGNIVTSGSGGKLIRPSDVHATVMEAMGLNWDHLENQLPTILESALT